MTTDEAGLARPDAPEGDAQDQPNLAALLDDDAERTRLAYGEPEAEGSPDPAPDSDDSADDDDVDEDDDAPEDDEETDDEEEGDSEPAGEQPQSAAGWFLELVNHPNRRTEVPKRFRKELEALETLAQTLVQGTAQQVRRQLQTQASRTETLRELWDAGDIEAFTKKAAEDPEAHRLFLQQQLEGVDAAAAARTAADPQAQITAAAQQQLARLSAHPEAKERVLALARDRGWTANAADLAEMTAAVTQELERASRPSREQERARKTQEAAARRKRLPKADISQGADIRGRIDPDKFLNMSDGERAALAFRS